MKVYDRAKDEQSLDDDGTMTLTVETPEQAEDVIILIDDGSQDGTPAGYEMTQRLDVDETEGSDDFRFYDNVGSDSSPETARSWIDPAYPTQMQVVIQNRSGGQATFRVTVFSVGGV